MSNKILNIADLQEAASKSLPVSVKDFFNSGATNQVTLHDNYTAYRKYRLLPRVLKDVSQVDTGISLLVGTSSSHSVPRPPDYKYWPTQMEN
ncbi:Peptidase M13 neprilysin [Penicillium canescens]|nr:Peptidase M13 neprilysin [Penicillium canescens]